MSISDEVARLQQAKQDIKTSIESKGVEIGSDVKLDLYSTFIDNISSGDGDNEDLAQYLWNAITNGGINGSSMFGSCNNLTTLDVSNFDTSNVTNMSDMFSNCTKLTTLDVSNFDTSNVTDMGSMFNGCINLTSLDVSNFDTSKVTSMGYMFRDCNNLTTLDLSNFVSSLKGSAMNLFYNCKLITELDLRGLNFSQTTDTEGLFRGCSNLTTILGEIDLSNTKYINLFFENCTELTEVHLVNICKNTMSDSSVYDLALGSTKINTECLLEIINELSDTSSKGFSRILTLPTINTLTEEQVQVAIDKGWNVANINY